MGLRAVKFPSKKWRCWQTTTAPLNKCTCHQASLSRANTSILGWLCTSLRAIVVTTRAAGRTRNKHRHALPSRRRNTFEPLQTLAIFTESYSSSLAFALSCRHPRRCLAQRVLDHLQQLHFHCDVRHVPGHFYGVGDLRRAAHALPH